MSRGDRLIVGLGNPGPEYAETRHNVGFMVVDRLAEEASTSFSHEKGDVLLARARHRGRRYGLAKPMSYMNRSGGAVLTLVRRFGLDPGDVLVIYDDIHLDVGRMRLREKGSAGGHNGVQDIIDRLGTDVFPRLRIGVGSDFPRGRQADYVLSPFTPDQLVLVDEVLGAAREAALTFVTDGVVTAMNRYNR